MSSNDLLSAINRFTAAVVNRTSMGYGVIAIQEEITINSNATMEYDLTERLQGDPSDYDFKAAAIILKVRDNDINSVTHGTYIDALSVISAGVSVDGIVKIHNHTQYGLTMYLRVDVPYNYSA